MPPEGSHEILLPWHGLSGGREIVETQLALFKALRVAVKKYSSHDMNDFAAFKDLTFFTVLGRVIGAVYRQIEVELFLSR